MTADSAVLDWLLDSDPALRWQVERDLAGAPPEVWLATRGRVATEGFGAELLARQDADGQWAGGAFFPADFDFSGPEAGPGQGQPWTATTWSLNALRDWGLEASALGDTADRLGRVSRWEYQDLPFWGGEVDVCINSYTLMNGAWLGVDVSGLARWFVEHRLEDGGWNCDWIEGSARSSFHSTLNAIRGLLFLEHAAASLEGDLLAAVIAARHSGEEYLLERRLLRTLRSSELVGPWVSEFFYPPRWRYSALAALEHLRLASLADGTPPDPRLVDAVSLVRKARRADGTWEQQGRLPGRVWFHPDVEPGEPSRWVTFQARRVLDWWDESEDTRS